MSRLLLTEPVSRMRVEAVAPVTQERASEETDLSPSQQLALLTLARTELSRMCVAALQRSTVRATAIDYFHLQQAGLAIRERGSRWHEITPRGKWRADSLARIVARDLSLHLIIRSGGGRYESSVSCTCGKFHYSHSRNEGHERTAFARRIGAHLREVGASYADVVMGSPL